ncbi:hypothetical protein HZY97_09595 [Sphingomonas sp. R-74633]|nr:hypothetical protein [Sphingomonas sp. R-74633]
MLKRLPEDFGEIWLRRKRRHKLRIRVLDEVDPKGTRWTAELPLIRASVLGFGGLAGFTDKAAIRGDWHGFEVLGRPKVRGFLTAMAPLLRAGLIDLKVDGRSVGLTPEPSRPRAVAVRRSVARAIKPAERSVVHKRERRLKLRR